MEHQQHQHLQQLVNLDSLENSNARALVLKLINVLLTILQVVLLLVATVANIITPFLHTRSVLLFACRPLFCSPVECERDAGSDFLSLSRSPSTDANMSSGSCCCRSLPLCKHRIRILTTLVFLLLMVLVFRNRKEFTIYVRENLSERFPLIQVLLNTQEYE